MFWAMSVAPTILSGQVPTPVLLPLGEARGPVCGLSEHRQYPTASVSRPDCTAELKIWPFENSAL